MGRPECEVERTPPVRKPERSEARLLLLLLLLLMVVMVIIQTRFRGL